MRRFLMLLLAMLLLAGAPALAESVDLLGKHFDVPAGWTLHPMEGGAAMWPAADGDDPASVVVLAPPFAYDGDLGLAVGQLADLAAQNGGLVVLQRGAVQAATSDKDPALEIAFLPTQVSDPAQAQTFRTYIAVRSAGQVHLFQVTSTSAEADQRSFAMLATFLDAVTYLPAADAEAPQASEDPGNVSEGGGNCRIVTRQHCVSQMMGAFPNMVPVYNCLPMPQTVCDGQ